MNGRLRIFKIIALITAVLLMVNSSHAQETLENDTIGAYGGSISTDKIQQNSEVVFVGSTYNMDNTTIFFIKSMNVTFLELLGSSTNRDPKLLNLTKDYPSSFRLSPGDVYSDTYKTKVDLNPGKYNVSIGFVLLNGSADISPKVRNALSNHTVQVVGVSQSQKILRAFFYTILTIVGIVILFYVYLKYIKK